MRNITFVLTALLLAACAETVIINPSTGTKFKTHANAQEMLYTDGNVTFHAVGLDHSTATLAGGAAFSQGVNALGGAISGITLAAGTSGLFGPGMAVTSRALVVPFASVASHAVSKPSLPKSTPQPLGVRRPLFQPR